MEAGHVMKTHNIHAFKLFGRYYTTNPRRKKKYSMDDESWELSFRGLFYKIRAVLRNEVTRLV